MYLSKMGYLKYNRVWTIYFLIKIFYMFFALFVFSKLTTLGDTFTYLKGTIDFRGMFINSTIFMNTFAGFFSMIFGPVLANIPFLALSFYGIYYPMSKMTLKRSQLIFLLFLLSLPSFGVWTSIASKEAVGVFYLGIILGFIIDVIKRTKIRNRLLVLLSFYLCFLFKPQYLIGIVSLLVFVLISRKFALKGLGKLIVLCLFFLISTSILYLFRYQINDLSFIMPYHFSLDAGSTRDNTIWVNDFDVFRNAPYGMFIGFFGPTISEAFSKPTHLLAFIESAIIICIFLYAVLNLILNTLKIARLNVFYLGVFLTSTLWILFVHYPFGALNPGSAIRYRENFYGFLVILFYFLYKEFKNNFNYHYHRAFKN